MSVSASSIKWAHETINKRMGMEDHVSAVLSVDITPAKPGDTKSVAEIGQVLKHSLAHMEVQILGGKTTVVLQWAWNRNLNEKGGPPPEAKVVPVPDLFMSING